MFGLVRFRGRINNLLGTVGMIRIALIVYLGGQEVNNWRI